MFDLDASLCRTSRKLFVGKPKQPNRAAFGPFFGSPPPRRTLPLFVPRSQLSRRRPTCARPGRDHKGARRGLAAVGGAARGPVSVPALMLFLCLARVFFCESLSLSLSLSVSLSRALSLSLSLSLSLPPRSTHCTFVFSRVRGYPVCLELGFRVVPARRLAGADELGGLGIFRVEG